jgi:hypothetical protein
VNRIVRDLEAVAPVLTIFVTAGLLLGAIGWAVAREPASVVVTPTLRFVAFALAAMGLAWLIAPFVAWASRPCPALGASTGWHPQTALSFGGVGTDTPKQTAAWGCHPSEAVWPALFRWAALIDAAGVAIFIASIVSDAVTWRQGLMLYAILASFSLLQLAAMALVLRIARSPGLAAIVGVAIMVVGCTSLMWGHLVDRPFATGSPGDRAARAAVRYVNPLLAANDAITPPTSFDWAHHEHMYSHYGIIGESQVIGLPNWPVACGWYLAVAAVLGVLAWLCRPVQPARTKKTTTDFTDVH